MVKGISFALSACFIWAFIYVIPQFMVGFTSLEISLGRYLVYGIVSVGLYLRSRAQGGCIYPRDIWIKGLYFSLISTIGYYTFVVLALRYSTPAICALVLGISPVTIAFYGNWLQREIDYKSLVLPSILILFGLAMINIPHIQEHPSLSRYVFGLLCSIGALAAWTWYVIANSRLLKERPELPSSDWCTIIGIGTLFWVFVFAIVLGLFFQDQIHPEKYFVWNQELIGFIIGSLVLGIFCSWMAEFLWNRASVNLPVAIMGHLTIAESVFAVLFVFVIDRHLPPYIESAGIALQLCAVIYGIQQFTKRERKVGKLGP